MKSAQRLCPPVSWKYNRFIQIKIWIIALLASFTFIDAYSQQNSLPLNGTDQFVTLSDLSLFSNSQRDFSVEIWFQSNLANQNQVIFSIGNNSPGFGFSIQKNSSNLLEVEVPEGPIITSTLDINDTEWHHASIIYRDSTFYMYLDGSAEGSSNYNISLDGSNAELGRSVFSNSDYFSGELDQLKIWEIALEEDQLFRGIFQETATFDETGIYNYFAFNQANSTNLEDLINGENGFLQNLSGTEWVGSTALTPQAIASTATGAFSSSATWFGGRVPRMINQVSISAGDSVYLDSNTGMAGLVVQSTGAFDHSGNNTHILKDLDILGNYYSEDSDTIFMYGYNQHIDGSVDLPLLYFANGSLIDILQPITTKGGVFIDSTGVFNSFGYNTTLTGTASWEAYGFYNLTGDTVKFNGSSHTILGKEFGNISVASGTLTLLDTLYASSSLISTGAATLDLGSNVVVPPYYVDLSSLDTIIWTSGASFYIDQFMGTFNTGFDITGSKTLVYPTIEVVENGEIDLGVSMTSLPLGPKESLLLNGGRVNVTDGYGICLDDSAQVVINSGEFSLGRNGIFLGGSGVEIINNGGDLKLGDNYIPGEGSLPAVIEGIDVSSGIEITQNNGTLQAGYAHYYDLVGGGINIEGGNVTKAFNTSSFLSGSGDAYITINSSILDDLALDSVGFYAGPSKNIIKTAASGTGTVYVNSAFGDFVGPTYDSIDAGDITWLNTVGELDFALSLDATDYVSFLAAPDFTSSMTFETWLYLNSGTGTQTIVELEWGPDAYTRFQVINNQLQYSTNNGIDFSLGTPDIYFLPNKQWMHVAVVVSTGNNIQFYVNGQATNFGGGFGTSVTGISPTLTIGSTGGTTEFLNGALDELRIWNSSLSQTEIQANMFASLTGSETFLEAYYDMSVNDPTSDTDLFDLTANAYHGVLETFNFADSSGWISSEAQEVQQQALNFGGATEFVGVPGGPQYETSMTLEAWVRPEVSFGDYTIASWDFTGSENARLQISNGELQFVTDNGISSTLGTSPNTLTVGEWSHVVLTKNGNDVELFVNGFSLNSGTISTHPSGGSSFVIGAREAGGSYLDFFDGDIDELRVWNTVVQLDTLRSFYTTEDISSHPDLANISAKYDFNEGLLAFSLNTNDTVLFDDSGNAFDGNLNGSWVYDGSSSNWVLSEAFDAGVIASLFGDGIFIPGDASNDPVFSDRTKLGAAIIEKDTITNFFQLYNDGFDTLVISNIESFTPEFYIDIDKTVILPEDSAEISVDFIPTYTGVFTGTMSIDFGVGKYEFLVEGVGYPDESGPGSAITFNGIDQSVILDNDEVFSFTKSDSVTLEAWVFPTDTTGIKTILGKQGITSGAEGYQFRLNGAKLEFRLIGDITFPNVIEVQSIESLDSAVWNHIAVTYNGGAAATGVNMYINGEAVATTTLSDNISTTDIGNVEPAQIGSANGGSRFEGAIDEIRLWSSVRTATEISDNYLSMIDASEHDLLSYFPANFGIDSLVYDLARNSDGEHDRDTESETFVTSHVPLNNESKFEELFDKDAIWEARDLGLSANLYIANESFLGDKGDNVVYAHDNNTVGDGDLTTEGIIESGGLISRRLERSWYIEFSDSTTTTQGGQLDFVWDNMPIDSAFTYYLLARLDESMDFIPVSYAGTATLTDSLGIGIEVDSLPEKAFYTVGISDAFPGNAVILDGVDDSLVFDDIGYNDAVSMEFWARINEPNPNQSPILSHGSLSDSVNIYIDTDSTLIVDMEFTGSIETVKSSIKVVDDTWHHIAFTRDNTDLKIYIDGVEDAGASFINSTFPGTISAANWGGTMLIGRDVAGKTTNMSIDELKIWQVTRDSAQIAENYLLPANGFNGDLEAYYRFDQFAGYTVPDHTGSGRVGRLAGNIDFDFSSSGWIVSDGFVAPTNQNALEFDGSGDYVTVPNIANYDVADNIDFTLEAWVKPDGTNADGAGIITMATSAATFTGFSMIMYHGRLGVAIGDGSTVFDPSNTDLYGNTIIDDNDWHHVALSFSRSNQQIEFFVDGILEWRKNISILDQNLTSGVFNIGTNYDQTIDFSGEIDEVRFWSTQKSESEIQEFVYDRPSGFEDNLEAYFNFDQGVADDDNTSISALIDESGNFNNGSLNGFALSGTASNFVESEIDSLRARLKLFTNDVDILNPSDTLNIGVTLIGDTTYQQLRIANVGNDILSFSSITFGNAEFEISQVVNDSTLNPFDVRDLEIFVVPSTQPFTYSSVDVVSNDALSPLIGTLETTVYPDIPGAGEAISFNGTSSDYAISDEVADRLDSFTIEFWANRTDETSNDIAFSIGNSGANTLLNVGFQTGDVAILGFGSDDLTANYSTLNSDWNHWAFTYDTTTREQRILLNGIEIGNKTATENFLGSGQLYLGRSAIGGDDFGGEIDELRIWGYALPDSIIREHLASEITGQSSNVDGILAYFRMDEGADSKLFDLVEGIDFDLIGSTRVTSGAYLGDNSRYNYSSNEIDVTTDGEPIKVTNVSNFTEGFHAYVVRDTPSNTSATGFENISDTVYYGVFAPGSTFDLEVLYTPDSGEDSLRIVRRTYNNDLDWSGASDLFNTDTANDSIFTYDQTSGEFALTKLNYPILSGAGDALQFDGTNEYVDIPHSESLNIAENDFTLEAWVNLNDTDFETILSKGDGNEGSSPDVFTFQIQSSKIGLNLSDGTTSEWGLSSSDLPTGQWTHVAVAYESATQTATFYLNGIADGQHTYALSPINHADANSAFIGKQGYNCDCNYFNGQIDEVRIWNNSLGQDTISSYVFSTLDESHPQISSLVYYSKFDDGTGSGTLHDLKGNLVGSLTNMETGSDWIVSEAFSLPAYTVINTNDSGAGSLRAVLDSANTNSGMDTIKFDIPGTGPWVINLLSSLSATDSVFIDGTTQPGWDFTSGMVVELFDGTNSFEGLEFVNDYFEVYGLRFNGLNSGININSNTDGYQIGAPGSENIFINNTVGIQGVSGSNGTIESNYIGLDYDSIAGANSTGILFNGTSTANVIGSVSNPNIIANNSSGIVFDGSGTVQNQISVNTILCNGVGISLENSAHNDKTPPTIDSIDDSNVFGSGVTGDNIDVYIANDTCSSDQGIAYLGSATVVAGTWNLTGLSLIEGDTITVIAYNTTDGSSPFSAATLFGIPPAEPTVDAILVNTTEPIITGSYEIGTDLDVTVDGLTYVLGADANLTDDGVSIWMLDLAGLALPGEGLYDVSVNSTNVVTGLSTSDTTTDEIEIDLTAPTVPTVDALLTNSVNPVLTGTSDFADSLGVTVDGITYVLDIDLELSHDGLSTWTLDLSALTLTEGIYEVEANTKDLAGNISTDASTNELEIDLSAPTIPSVDSLITNNVSPLITGSSDAADSLEVAVDGVNYILDIDPELTHDGSTTWTLDLSAVTLTEGVYEIGVTTTDLAGNVSMDSTTNELEIDLTLPLITVNAQTTNDLSPELTGAVDDVTATIEVSVDGIDYTATNNEDGTWTLADNSIVPDLSSGTYEITASATDLAGNIGTDASSNELIISAVPLAEEAININAFDFTASWTNYSGISGYVLDVADDNSFTSFVSGYQNFSTSDTSEVVTGLNYNTTYYYRVRAVIAENDTSSYSNVVTVETTILSGTIADSTALLRIYDNMNGADWIRNDQWNSGRVEFWENITFTDGRVVALDLSDNNLVGDFPVFSGEEFDQLTTLLLNDNEINSIEDLSSLPLTDLQVQNNNLGFETLELLAGISGTFSPQDSLLSELDIIENEGDDISLDRLVGGSANTYQWFKDGSILSGQTSSSLDLTSISFDDEGAYHVEVENTIATGIILFSNPINLKVSSLERDTTALRAIYEALGGDNWTENNNWFSDDITTWDRIGSDGSRVTSVDLSNNNLGGTGILPEDVLDLINVTSINLSDNRTQSNDGLLEVPDLSSMPNLTSLDVSGNSLQFGSIESMVGNIGTFLYDNQAQVGDGFPYSVEKGETINLSVEVSGENNTYQWRRNGSNISGANSADYVIVEIDYENMGTYDCIIENTVATSLTLSSKENFTEAHVDIEGDVIGNGDPLSTGTIYALKIEPDKVGFDSVAVVDITNGGFLLDDLVLGDYVIAAEANTDDFLPTYYVSSFLWEEADTLFLRDTLDGFQINMQADPGDPSELGDGGLGGYLEDELNSEEGRLEAGRRVKRAGVMLRRRPPDSRGEDDEGFVLYAYVQTDDNGEFSFENLASGTYRINFEYPGVPMDPDSFVEFELGVDGSEDSFTVVATVTEDGIVVVPVDVTRIFTQYFKDLTIFPNPAYNKLYIQYSRLNSDRVILNVHDLRGSILKQYELNKGVNQTMELDLSELQSGSYLLHFLDRDTGAKIGNARIIKN